GAGTTAGRGDPPRRVGRRVLGRERPGPEPRDRHERQQDPVADKQRRRHDPLRPRRRLQQQQDGGDVAERDPLEHAGNAYRLEVDRREGEVLLEHAQHEEDGRADERVPDDARIALAATPPARDGEGQGDADDEQEEREDPVGGRGAVPRYVLEHLVALAGAALLVHEQHRGDGHAAEDVERVQPGEGRSVRGGGHDSGKAKATYVSPDLVPILPPPAAMTTNWRPFTVYTAGVA